MIGNGLDISNYQWPLTADICAAWYASGVRYVIVGCQRPDVARQQIPLLRAAGIQVVATYAYLYWGYDVSSETQNAIDIAKEFNIHAPDWLGADMFLDCENGGELPGVGVDTRHPQMEACVAQVQGASLRPGVYTGQPFWEDSMGNSTDFAALPLWHAAYWYDLHFVATVSYGGWTKVSIHQVTATGNSMYDQAGGLVPVPQLNGVNVDYDEFFNAEVEMPIDPTEFRALLADYFDPQGPGGFTNPDGTPMEPDARVIGGIAKRLPAGSPSASVVPPHQHTLIPQVATGEVVSAIVPPPGS